MGLCSPVVRCAICTQSIGTGCDVIGFPDLVPMFSEFGDFYDGCAHQDCMTDWPRKEEFVTYFNGLVDVSKLSPSWRLLILPSGRVRYQRDHCNQE